MVQDLPHGGAGWGCGEGQPLGEDVMFVGSVLAFRSVQKPLQHAEVVP